MSDPRIHIDNVAGPVMALGGGALATLQSTTGLGLPDLALMANIGVALAGIAYTLLKGVVIIRREWFPPKQRAEQADGPLEQRGD